MTGLPPGAQPGDLIVTIDTEGQHPWIIGPNGDFYPVDLPDGIPATFNKDDHPAYLYDPDFPEAYVTRFGS